VGTESREAEGLNEFHVLLTISILKCAGLLPIRPHISASARIQQATVVLSAELNCHC
jgi:hypothetical protein